MLTTPRRKFPKLTTPIFMVLTIFCFEHGVASAETPDPEISMRLHVAALILKDQFAEAIQELSSFIDAHPNHPNRPEFVARRAQVKLLAGDQIGGQKDLREVLPSLDKKINDHPTDANWYYYRGMAYKGLNEREKAIVDLRKALELKPTYAEAKATLRVLGIE